MNNKRETARIKKRKKKGKGRIITKSNEFLYNRIVDFFYLLHSIHNQV